MKSAGDYTVGRRKKYSSERAIIQNHMDSIINNIPHYVFWKDTDSIFIGCNKKFSDYLGLRSPKDICGKSDFDMPWGRDLSEKYILDDKDIIASGKPKLDYEEIQIHPDKTERVVLVNKIPIFGERGEVAGILCIYTDITDRKDQEKTLNRMLAQVSALSQAKSDFIANMSHDVKTPLSGIIGMTEVLKQQLKLPANISHINTIHLAGQQLMHLLENCMRISNPENMAITSARDYFNLRELLMHLSQLFQPSTRSKNLHFSVVIDSRAPEFLLGCRDGLYRVLLNLIGNAIKFTQKGGIDLSVSVGEKSCAQKCILKIVIKDTGIGIPEEQQKIIFERFTRLTPSWQGVYEGNGIGLYVVSQYVTSMGGEVHIRSRQGEGSRFIVILPFEIPLLNPGEYVNDNIVSCDNIVAETPGLLFHHSPGRSVTDAQPEIHGSVAHRILLVEDNAIAQKVALALLSSLGCQIDVAGCGRQALTLFDPGKYDLILMDIGLPDFSGYTVSELIRKIEQQQGVTGIPIIALTAHASETSRNDCQRAGINDLLEKPLSLEKGRQIIAAHIPGAIGHTRKSTQDFIINEAASLLPQSR